MSDEVERRERSTIQFPYAPLDDAVEVAKAIHENAGLSCSTEQLAAYLDHTATSGTFRVKLAAARIFRLIQSVGKAQVELTETGRAIVDSPTERAARVEAFLAVPLYSQLFERFKTGKLPGDQGLETEIQRLGVSAKQKDRARQVFQRSAEQAGFFDLGKDRLVKPAIRERKGRSSVEQEDQSPPPPKDEQREEFQHNSLIVGLFQKLPPENEAFGTDAKRRWLDAARVILDLVWTPSSAEVGSTHDQAKGTETED